MVPAPSCYATLDQLTEHSLSTRTNQIGKWSCGPELRTTVETLLIPHRPRSERAASPPSLPWLLQPQSCTFSVENSAPDPRSQFPPCDSDRGRPRCHSKRPGGPCHIRQPSPPSAVLRW